MSPNNKYSQLTLQLESLNNIEFLFKHTDRRSTPKLATAGTASLLLFPSDQKWFSKWFWEGSVGFRRPQKLISNFSKEFYRDRPVGTGSLIRNQVDGLPIGSRSIIFPKHASSISGSDFHMKEFSCCRSFLHSVPWRPPAENKYVVLENGLSTTHVKPLLMRKQTHMQLYFLFDEQC